MSIVLLIADNNLPKENRNSIPVATESVFSRFWLTASRELNLQYVPLFQTGITIDSDLLDDVESELKKLKVLMKEKCKIDKDYQSSLEKLNLLLDVLPKMVEKHKTVYIG